MHLILLLALLFQPAPPNPTIHVSAAAYRPVAITWEAQGTHMRVTREKDGQSHVVFDGDTEVGDALSLSDFDGCPCLYTFVEEGRPAVQKYLRLVYLPVVGR